VVWYVGTNSEGLNETERANLMEYVYNDGNLFLSGQDLAKDFCDPGSPYYSAESHAWFQDLLGVDYAADDADSDTVMGVIGDPVSDGMNFAINGGDGANNNVATDVLTVLSNGAESLIYSSGPTAGVRGAYGDGRTFISGFGFEGVSSATSRNDLMTAILDWITNPFTAVGDHVQVPLLQQPYVTPNPFNPQTSIKFEVGGSQAVNAEVVIYDLRGRAINHLFRGVLEPGPKSLTWNGRDDGGRGLASGIYLALVKVGDETRPVKMTLAR
jgi:hypothetical protein